MLTQTGESAQRAEVPAIVDADMWRVIMTGASIGTAGLYVLVFVMCVIAGVSTDSAAGIAVLPAVFGGVYAGGAVTLLLKMLRHERQERRH
jgi:hypothetical protein